ncbi:hypothetical protein GQ53DRAFT_766898 [Thozetella sp. PMI_491]|nr:hypothetical protein GQ53DRAFT_766898 [Thozetella sp. PMI_491]
MSSRGAVHASTAPIKTGVERHPQRTPLLSYNVLRNKPPFTTPLLQTYDVGHRVPYFQLAAALTLFPRTISGVDSATVVRLNSQIQSSNFNSEVPKPLAVSMWYDITPGLPGNYYLDIWHDDGHELILL